MSNFISSCVFTWIPFLGDDNAQFLWRRLVQSEHFKSLACHGWCLGVGWSYLDIVLRASVATLDLVLASLGGLWHARLGLTWGFSLSHYFFLFAFTRWLLHLGPNGVVIGVEITLIIARSVRTVFVGVRSRWISLTMIQRITFYRSSWWRSAFSGCVRIIAALLGFRFGEFSRVDSVDCGNWSEKYSIVSI